MAKSLFAEHIDSVMGTPDEQPSVPASPLTEHIDAVMSSSDLADSLRLTVGTNPEEAAQAKRLSKELDIPEGILPPLQVAEQEAFLKRVNPDQLKQDTPATANFLTNPDNARIVGRDVESLAKMEKTVLTSEQFTERVREIRKENPTLSIDEARAFAKLYPDSGKPKARSTTEAVLKDPLKAVASGVNRFGATMVGVQRMNPLGDYHPGAVAVTLAQRAVEVLAPSLYKDPRQLEEDVRAGLLRGADYWTKQKSEDIQARVEKYNQAGALESVKMLLSDPGLMVDQLSQSAIYMLPMMAGARGGVASTYAMGTVMEALDAALSAREEAREAGLTLEEQDRAANTAALITAPIAFLGNKLARTGVLETEFFTKGTIGGSLLDAIVREGISGGVEEAGNTFGVNVSAQMYYDPTRQLLQGVPKSFAVGGLLEATHGAGMSAVSNVVGATAVKLNRAIENHVREEAQARRAQDRFEALRELSAQATENGVRTRSAETFREFVNTMTEGQSLETVYVAPATLRAALADPSLPLDQITSRFPELMTAMQAAEQTGTDVEITTADYLTYLAGTPVEEKIIQELRTEPGGMTYSEANTFYQEQRKVFEEAAAEVVEEAQPVLTRKQFEQARSAQDETVPAARAEGEPQAAPDTDIVQQAETYEEYLELHKNREAVRRAQRAEVENALLNDMRKLGKFPATMNRAYVAPLAAFYETQAREMGISPLELYNRLPLRVTGTNFGPEAVMSQTTPATPADFRPDKVADILKKDDWAILTAENPNNQKLSPEENAARMSDLLERLRVAGFEYMMAEGFYDRHENSVVVFGISQEDAAALGRVFGQESVLTREGFVYQDGSIAPTTGDVEVFDVAPDNYYSTIRFPDGAVSRFSVGLDFKTRIQPGEVRPIPVERIGALDQTQTPEFKRWFGDSVVTDNGKPMSEGGKPLVVYHGTGKDFSVFRRSDVAIFLTPDAEFAASFAETSATENDISEDGFEYAGANVMPVYVAAKNPFDYENKEHVEAVFDLVDRYQEGAVTKEDIEAGDFGTIESDEVQSAISELGFDAFYVEEGGVKNLGVYSPRQIKSAIGNQGTFDPADSNIVLQGGRTDQTQTPEFKRWFGDSKVVDEQGRPLVVYHGTNAEFNAFKPSPTGALGAGIYLSGFNGEAGQYGDRVIAAYASIENPVTGTFAEVRAMQRPNETAQQWTARMIADGHDGIITRTDAGDVDYVVAFRPEQIKSATGNNGQFDPANPNIFFQGGRTGENLAPLANAPEGTVPTPRAREARAAYLKANPHLRTNPVTEYVPVNQERAARIAEAYEQMEHNPSDPDVAAAYEALIKETLAQYEFVLQTGLEIEFIPEGAPDPYAASPRLAIEDVQKNNHLWVFPTRAGFGTLNAVTDNPLLAETPYKISGQTALANDIFRVVHDYFGHIAEGVGFRATGEENAWRLHSAMYSPLARKALTTETRGQNSWVNFGPYGEQNRTASGSDTVYADQKVGLLPDWVVEEGSGQEARAGARTVVGVHFSRAPREILSGSYYGTGIKGAEAERVAQSSDPRIKSRLYFYVDEGKGVFPEDGVGRYKHTVTLTNLYDGARNPLRLPTKNADGETDMNVFESAVIDAGFDGYYVENAFGRQGAVVLLGDASERVRVVQPVEMYQSAKGSVEERFWRRLEDFDAAVADYTALPDSKGGKVLDVDVARELSEDYLADRTLAHEVHEPASAFIKRLFAKKLAEAPQPGEKAVVLFTAGGGGAGKSTAIRNATTFMQESQIVYDGTLANYESAKTKIEQALAAGKEVQIALVVREPVAAFTNGVLSRAMEQAAEHGTGRVVKVDVFIEAHIKAPQTVQRLAADYANDPRVHIVAFDNVEGSGGPVEINVADATKYVYNDLEARVNEALRRAYEEGRITQEVYEAVRTPTGEGVPSGVREGVREGAEGRGQGQSTNAVAQGPRGSYNLDQLVISLLQGADWSTMIHESGHFFLEGLFATARMPEATPRMKADAQKVLDWFGVTQEQWDSFDIEQKRPYHEQWAQSFERWAFEGVAPSLKLQPIFSRFMAWMKSVYKSMEDFLRQNPLAGKLNDEIRDVFGRLMASEQLIREAQDARSYAPLFKTAEEAGVPRSKFEAYMELAQEAQDESISRMQARSLRDMKWLNNAQSARLKELQHRANDLRKQIREEVTKQVMAEPVNQAKTFLRHGKLTDPQTGEVVEASTGHKISTDVLAALYPDGNPNNPDLSKLRGMTAKDGVDPDVIAPMFGFQSGDQMVRAIASAEDVQAKIEGLTDQRMLEEHGELVDERAIQRAVEESLHTEARARFMATGLTLLTKVGNVQQIMRAAKETAERVISGKRVRDIKPAQYTAAETRANKEAIKSAATNPQRAAEAQRTAILNNRLAKAAMEAEAEVESALRYLKKFTREGTRKNLDTDYLEQIDSLLEPFDLRTGTTLRTIDSRTSLRDWMAQQEALGFEPIIDPELVAEARQKHYKNMTMDELRTLVDTVKSIEHLGRLKHKLLTAQDARDFQTRIAEARDSIARNANRTVKEKPTPNDALGRFGQFVRRMAAGHRKFASFIRELDGGKDLGVMANLLLYPMYEAGSLETDLRMKAAQDVDKLFEPIYSELKQLGGLYSRRLNIPGTDFSLTTEERLMFALNWGNEGNRQRLLDGGIAGKRALTLNDVQAVLDTLTREEWQFVQGVWDYFETYRPMIAEQERMLTGKTPEWVEPSEIETKFGVMRGGYFPAKYDTNLSTRSEILEAAVDLRQAMKGAFNRAGTRNSYAQQRAEAVKNRPLLLSFDVISRHVHEVTHRLAWQAWLVDASRVLDALDPDIRQHLGVEALQAMREHVRDVAQGDAPVTGTTDVVLKRIRTGTSIVGMGYRVSTALLQPAGITQSWARLGIANIMNGIVETVKNPAAAYAFIMENSAFMRNRGKTMNREINEIVNQVRAGKKLSALQASYFFMITKMQLLVDIPTYLGAYNKALADLGYEQATSAEQRAKIEKKAHSFAGQTVIDTQTGGEIKDLSNVQKGGQGQKLFTNFYSFFAALYNLNVENFRTKKLTDPVQFADFVATAMLLNVVPAVYSVILRNLLKGECDWDDAACLADRYKTEQMGMVFGQIIGVRELGAAVDVATGGDYFGSYGPPSMRFFGEAMKLGVQLEQGDVDMALFKAANNTAGIVFHYPAGQINTTLEGMLAIENGEVEGAGMIGALISGPPR